MQKALRTNSYGLFFVAFVTDKKILYYIEDYMMIRNNIKREQKKIEKKRILFLTMIYKSDIMVLQRKEKQ